MSVRHGVWLVIGVGAVAWSAPLIRLAEAPAIVIAALRLGFAAPPATALALTTRRGELASLRRRELLLLGLAGLALAGHLGLWVASVQRTSVIASTALVTMQPLFVGAGAWLWLGERPTRALAVGAAIATAGAFLLAAGDLGDRGSLGGDALAVGGAALAGTYLLLGRHLRATISNRAFVGAVLPLGALLLLGLLFASGESLRGHSREAYLYILLIALVPQLLGHGALTWALGALPAAVVAVAILGEPAGATLIGATVLDEVPTLLEGIGAAVLLAGVYVGLRNTRAAAEAQPLAPGAMETTRRP